MRLHHQMTFAQRKLITTTADGQVAVLVPLSGIEVTYFTGGTYNPATDDGALASIFQSSDLASNAQGPAPEAGASGGPNPYTTGITGAAETWLAPSVTGYDIRIRDTIAPARIPTRTILRWGFAPNAGIPTTAIDPDGGLTLAHIGPDILRQDVPIGGVIDWFRPASSVPAPAGYIISDGTAVAAGQHDFPGIAGAINPPDLRHKFVLGANIANADGSGAGAGDTAANAPGIRGTGGSNTGTIPAHGHGKGTLAASGGSHGHVVSDPGHSHNYALKFHDLGNDTNPAPHTHFGTGGVAAEASNSAFIRASSQYNWPVSGSGTGISVNGNTHAHPNSEFSGRVGNAAIDGDVAFTQDNRPQWVGLLKIMKVKRA